MMIHFVLKLIIVVAYLLNKTIFHADSGNNPLNKPNNKRYDVDWLL